MFSYWSLIVFFSSFVPSIAPTVVPDSSRANRECQCIGQVRERTPVASVRERDEPVRGFRSR